MMQIPDPVHGYITLEGMYADIVNTPEFQRLRSIEQVSFRPSYPGARHDRFIHSLGTYHLATKFVKSFFRNLADDVEDIRISDSEKKKLTATFCYAALLHDIGHAPFSHTTEDFFLLPKAGNGKPQVWEDLCKAITGIDAKEGELFDAAKSSKGDPWIGAAHEIVSALLLVTNLKELTGSDDADALGIDLVLAARMVIGFTYKAEDLDTLTGYSLETLGVRNCLIQLLNSKTLDVDRLDYMCRDSGLTGFLNAPLDLDCLADSVTAAKQDDGLLAAAYRDNALRVFDLMFQAKLSHDAWVIGSPASLYEAELQKHCIRALNQKSAKYMDTIFTPKALGREGVQVADPAAPARTKHYRFLSDADVFVDLKAQLPSGGLYEELFTRKLDVRRIASWRSYYEYHHIFNAPALGVTPEAVYLYFEPLLNYMADPTDKTDKNSMLVFDAVSYQQIMDQNKDWETNEDQEKIVHSANTLWDYLKTLPSGEQDSFALLKQTSNLTLSLDPGSIRIVFHKSNIPLRHDGKNFSTYSDLTGITEKNKRSNGFFYLYRYKLLEQNELRQLRDLLKTRLEDARAKGILTDNKEDNK